MKTEPLKKCQFAGRLFLGTLTMAVLAIGTDQASGFQFLSPPATPVDAAASEPIRTLLTSQWERNPSNAELAQQTYESASKNNSTLLVAYAINQLHQNRTRESKSAAEELTTSFPDNLDGWMLKIWFDTLEDNFDVALINMRTLKKQIDQTDKLPDATKIQIYKRLGRLMGYMQGPVVHRVNKDILDGTIVAIADGIAPDVLQAFSESRDQVLQSHDDLLKNQADKTQVELAKVRAENEQERIALENQNVSLEQTESQMATERARVRGEAEQQISSLERSGNSIQQQLNAISSDIQATQLSLQYMYADLAAVHHSHSDIYVSTYYLQNQIRNAEYSLSVLRNNGNQLSNQLNGVGSQILRTRNGIRNQLQQMDKEIKRVNGAKRRNQTRLAKIARGPEVADGKRSSMKNRATSLVTYDEISEELVRQQILDHLTID